MDEKASYYIYAINNGNSMIWFLFRVAPVSVAIIRLICHVHRARGLHETRTYTIDTTSEKQSIII